MVEFFAMVGLKPNWAKTKFIMVQGAQVPLAQETRVYVQVQAKGQTHRQWDTTLVVCS